MYRVVDITTETSANTINGLLFIGYFEFSLGVIWMITTGVEVLAIVLGTVMGRFEIFCRLAQCPL